ncbi:PorT family protein [Segetibacter sp. 3557_3]|uniref:porin family protein n=1 Tax=Segetibacter sp. 3557_3 TaxID=2547429 RepID=UPI001058521D|nr:porin family protein [Segetibacter sp. 3557_3]TDH24191.1 PorT family protein [Segetibacter sp. 3557_3]
MKKTLLFSISLIFCTMIFAQQTTSFGVRAGASSTGMRGDAISSFKNLLDFSNGMINPTNRTGFFAGGYVNIPITEQFLIEPAIYYSQKGYVLNGSFNVKGMSFLGANAKARLNTQYIDLPVVIKTNFNGFQLFAGPQISYLLNADLRATAGVFGINLLNTKIDASPQFNRWDAALTGGIGYEFANGFNINAAYDYGFSRVDASRTMNSYNHAIKVGLGMKF